MTKVLIIGAGPAGSVAAINLSDKAEVTIIESKSHIGFPVKCGGLISENCYKELKKYGVNAKQNDIRGALIFSPSGKYAEMVGKSKAVVVERKEMDFQLLKKASENAEVMMRSKFVEARDGKAKIIASGKEKFLEFDYIVGADGAESRVANSFNFERPEIYVGLQFLMDFEAIDDRMVELYFGCKYSNGFFAYSIPIDDSTARIGVVSKDNPRYYLNNLLKKHPSVSERAGRSIFEINMGAIPLSLINFVKGNALLIGDAAGMVKPYTGGGIYYLLRAAEILGKNFPDLVRFREEYVREFKKEFAVGERIRKLYGMLSDEDYEFLINLAKNIDFANVDMDKPSTALKLIPKMLRLTKRPGIIKKIFGVV